MHVVYSNRDGTAYFDLAQPMRPGDPPMFLFIPLTTNPYGNPAFPVWRPMALAA